MQRADAGEDIFGPLRRNESLVKELIANQRVGEHEEIDDQASSCSVMSTDDSVFAPMPIQTAYNASVIERIASAKIDAGLHKSALKFCRDALKAWYSDAEEAVVDHFGSERWDVDDIGPLRDGIAKLWCVYAQMTTKVLHHAGNASQGRREQRTGTTFEVPLLDLARSCPLVGNHREVIQARLKLEFDDHEFLQNTDSATLEGFAGAIRNADVEGARIFDILSSAIAICNEAVQRLPMDFGSSFGVQGTSLQRDNTRNVEEMTVRHRWIANSISMLRIRVTALRSLWRPSCRIFDPNSTIIVCKEANRLSRIKEALEGCENVSDGLLNLGTEYGCDCGCWSVFATKSELFEHQKSCRGQHTAIGEHEKFERAKITYGPSHLSFCSTFALKDAYVLKKINMLEDESESNTWNLPRMRCCSRVEYGCDHGCCSAFATKGELIEHQKSCGGGMAGHSDGHNMGERTKVE